MNKIITLLLISCSISAVAQNDSIISKPIAKEISMKPQGKDFTVEVNFAPFSSSPVSISYLRFRTFTSEKGAVRLGFSVGAENGSPSEDQTAKTFELNLRPGYEWHFAGTDRLSPYVGLELDFAKKSSEFESDEDGNEFTIDGAWLGGEERGFTRIGANFIIGADVYIIKRLYLGTEIGFGFERVKSSNIEIEIVGASDPDTDKGGTTFQIGPNFNSSIRLGFVF